MKNSILRQIGFVVAITLIGITVSNQASAQQPVAYTTVQPAVVGYQFEWRGALGLRSRWNPVVAPVATTTVVTQPTVVQPVTVQPVTVQPVAVQPVTVQPKVYATVPAPKAVLKPVTYTAPVTTVTPAPVTTVPVYHVRY